MQHSQNNCLAHLQIMFHVPVMISFHKIFRYKRGVNGSTTIPSEVRTRRHLMPGNLIEYEKNYYSQGLAVGRCVWTGADLTETRAAQL